MTDHRVNVTLYSLDRVMEGGAGLNEIIDALSAADRAAKLEATET
jgi:peptide chain release factor 1